MKYSVQVLMHPQQDLYAGSRFYVGLLRLEAKGIVKAQFTVDLAAGRDPGVHVMEVTPEDGSPRLMAVDLYDRSGRFTRPILESVDIYFKRSYSPCRVAELPAEHREKIAPMGPNFACQTADLSARILRALGARFAMRVARAFFFDKPMFHHSRHMLTQFMTLPKVEEFESDGTDNLKPSVFLQTRVWEPEDVSDEDVTDVNEGRAQLVRSLRKELGDRFMGGLVPTAFAREHFPDAITKLPSRRDLYIAASRSAPIAIYCRGLHQSNAFKLGEYLAGAKAIVLEPLYHQMRAPLVDGKNVLSFDTPGDCVQRCVELLDNPQALASMRRENHFYYLDQVEPSADVLKCLEQACASPVKQ